VIYCAQGSARSEFASINVPTELLVEPIIEKLCFEDAAHAYARVRRIAKHKMKTYRGSPTYVAV